MDLIETFIEVVKHLEFVLRLAVQTRYFLDLELRLSLTIRVRLVEWQDFFFFGFKFPAELSSLKDSRAEILVFP